MAKDDSKGILDGKYEVGRQLGHGTFAKVYHGRHMQSGKSVALKVVAKDKVIKAGMTDQLKREISVMKMVRHANVVQLHEVLASKTKIYFVMELVRGGELFSIIEKQGKLNEHDARHYFHQLISAVDFCHSRKVYHRDLKPENLLVDEKNILKITDFGLSAFSDHIGQDGLLHTICGTPAYVAPEVIGRNGYDGAKADIWSCGVILYVLVAGFLPFRDDNIVAMYRKIYCGDFKCPPWFSTGAKKLIIQMLDPEPDTRISISEIMGSSWFKEAVVTKNVEAVVDDEETETLNAFHLISLSEGFDLSPLFEDKKRGDGGHKGEMRFATTRPVSCVVSKLEAVAKSVKFGIKRGDFGVRLLGVENGRKGKLGILVEMFVVAPSSLLVVEVKKSSGDTLEYNDFCRKELRPALKDIVWASASSDD